MPRLPLCGGAWFVCSGPPRHLHSFPTRRSSDLQATSSTSLTLVSAVGSLAGYALASNKALATLPSTMSVIGTALDRKSTRLNSSHTVNSYAVFCLKKKREGPVGGGGAALARLRQ